MNAITTKVRFYHNAPNLLEVAFELIERAYRGKRRIAVRLGDAVLLRQLDAMLWSHDQRAFIPHVALDSPLAAETPIVLATSQSHRDWPHHDMLFNLAGDMPPSPERFRMVIEIVGQGDAEKLPARHRWQQYKAAGFPLQAFDAERKEAL